MEFLKLDRPLVVFDIESTGVNPRSDRIVEIAAIKVHPNGARESKCWLINPGMKIPEDAIAVHGITNEAVEKCPKFRDVCHDIAIFFTGCDLGSFNHTRFDIPLLVEEFLRVGIHFDVDSRRIFDAQRIYHKKEPRDLTAAVKFYCDGEVFADAHGAEADTAATLRVFEGQFRKYPDLPCDPDELDAMLNERDPFNADRSGRLRWIDGELAINFGKNKGRTLRELAKAEPRFLSWILKGDFPRDTQAFVMDAMNGKFPPPPTGKPVVQSFNRSVAEDNKQNPPC